MADADSDPAGWVAEPSDWDEHFATLFARDERSGAAVAWLNEHGGPMPKGCPKTCTEHREHVYVLCYGRQVQVSDSDVGRLSPPISHYVGYTGGVPVLRIRRHGQW